MIVSLLGKSFECSKRYVTTSAFATLQHVKRRER
jgi:hypothetical protein